MAQDEAAEPGGVDKLDAPAVVEITDTVIRRDIRPIGVNPDSFGGWGMVDYTANQFIKGGGFEPVSMRWKGCVVAGGKGWFEADYMPPSRVGFRNIYSVAAHGDSLYVSDKDLRRIAKFKMQYREVKAVTLP